MSKLSRRNLLGAAGAAIAATSATVRRAFAGQSVKAQVFPISQPTISGPYPEQSIARYSAAQGQWGVSFSGGGPRAFSAALGQMRGLRAAGVVDDVGAISCVSGGCWFGATYTFAPANFSDTDLLGAMVPPSQITVSNLKSAPHNYLGTRIIELTDGLITLYGGAELAFYEASVIPFDKIYSRMIGDAFLLPYNLHDTSTLVTLNSATLAGIQQRNPGLNASFYMPRAGRPFFIGGGTQIYQQGKARQTPVTQVGLPGQFYRTIEYTPMYVGSARLAKQSSGGAYYGGGFVETFAFDTPAPTSISSNVVTLPAGQYPFLLSDIMGSSSAAIAAVVQDLLPKRYQAYDPFARFSYWPVTKAASPQAVQYDFGDGGILENTGIVSLLRRGYKTIFAFVNSPFPLGSTDTGCVSGVDGQISRLFGLIPENDYGTPQSTQVFATSEYQALAQGLIAARKAGNAPVYASTFQILQNNQFDLQPYAPKIFWIYNDVNEAWMSKLSPSVRALFKDPKNGLSNFPNYDTVLQNEGDLLYLSPIQVNLLAHMWAYTVSSGFSNFGYAFGIPIR